jgi:hypothetical protein
MPHFLPLLRRLVCGFLTVFRVFFVFMYLPHFSWVIIPEIGTQSSFKNLLIS